MKTLARVAILSLMLLLGAQVALTHAHGSTPHDAEVCAGHLGEHGAPDDGHPGACPLCRTSNRTRVLAGSIVPVEEQAASAPFRLAAEARPFFAATDRCTHAPRAPPISLV